MAPCASASADGRRGTARRQQPPRRLPTARHVIVTEDPFGVAGCALDGDGSLWWLSTHFSIRKDATAPRPGVDL